MNKKNLNNSDFIPIEFDGFRKSAGVHGFVLTPRQWIEKTGAVGILSKSNSGVKVKCQAELEDQTRSHAAV